MAGFNIALVAYEDKDGGCDSKEEKIFQPSQRFSDFGIYLKIQVGVVIQRKTSFKIKMKVSTLFFAASLLVSAWAQEGDDPSTITTTTEEPTSTTDAPESAVTLPPETCSSAGFEHCYRIITILTPTVYVILTADDPATIADAEPITSGDPILTQTDNIASSGQSIEVPTTALVEIRYSSSTGTTCVDALTTVSVLADDGDSECPMATAPFFSAPDQVTKTRVIRKVREDDTQGKGTETGGGGGGETSPTPAPGSTTDGNFAAVTTTDPAPEPTGGDTPTEPTQTDNGAAPTDDGTPTTEDNPQPTEGPTEEPVEEPTGTSPTSTEETPQETENTTGTTTTSAPEVPTTIAVPSSSSSTSASEETPSSDSTLPITDSSIPPSIDSTSTPTEDPSTSIPISTDSNDTPTDNPTTQTSGSESSRRAPTGLNESGKPEVSTAFTTIAETSDGMTKFLTSAVATMTRSAPTPTTSDGGSGAGPNFLVKAQVLFGAVGLAAVVGL
ncbi:hypothetical protein TWF703_001788 [Orbilia oligospora]|uniref:Uncharacterized protein n=1 Tax=Orbilia oligospora TaxID=2813651 RepID=A0A7C8JV54_ORBOL|nr:hypothetical protein TWF703_001788 [Orbilia oligospora]